MKCGIGGQGESDRSQSRSSSSDKVKCRSIGAGASGAHYRRVGVVSLPPEQDPDQESALSSGARTKAEVSRRAEELHNEMRTFWYQTYDGAYNKKRSRLLASCSS